MVWGTFSHVCLFDRGGGGLSYLGNAHREPTHFNNGLPLVGSVALQEVFHMSRFSFRWSASVLPEDALFFSRCALLGNFAVDG